jgi:hypothetical protein
MRLGWPCRYAAGGRVLPRWECWLLAGPDDLGPAAGIGHRTGVAGIAGCGQAGGGTGQGDDLRVALDGEQARAGRAARGEQQRVAGQVLQHGGLDRVLIDALDALRGAPAGALGAGA